MLPHTLYVLQKDKLPGNALGWIKKGGEEIKSRSTWSMSVFLSVRSFAWMRRRYGLSSIWRLSGSFMQISHMKHGINKPSLTHTNTETKVKAKMTKHQINKDIKNVVNETNVAVAKVQQIFGHTHTILRQNCSAPNDELWGDSSRLNSHASTLVSSSRPIKGLKWPLPISRGWDGLIAEIMPKYS